MPGHISEPIGPVDGRKVPRFAGSGSFGRLPEIDRVPDYDVAVVGTPFDSGTSYRPGARFGPMALPMLRSVVRAHGPVALVHFDAHLDTWDTYFNAPTTHGTIFRRAFEEKLPVEEHSIHVGTRGPITSWLPSMWTILQSPSRDDMPGCQVPSGSA
jgi:arginase family enzyme